MIARMLRVLFSLACVVGLGALALAQGAAVSYQLPTSGTLPKTYRVTLAVTAPGNPDMIVSTFASGVVRTVTKENQGRFTETWDGLDDNFMPVPPGTYGVKGIYMPAQKWAIDDQYHTMTAKFVTAGDSWSPPPGDARPMIVRGDPVCENFRDIDVGPNGIAVFYHQYLENSVNSFSVDLNRPIGYDQVLASYPSWGAAGGNSTATDGKVSWSYSGDGGTPFIFRADGVKFGATRARYRNNVYLPGSPVVSMACGAGQQTSLVYVAKKSGEIAILDGYSEEAAVKGTTTIAEPIAICRQGERLYALHSGNQVSVIALTDGLPTGTWTTLCTLKAVTHPFDLVVDTKGRLYVSDLTANQVYQLAQDGTVLRKYGKSEREQSGKYDAKSFMAPGKMAAWRDSKGKNRILIVEYAGPSRISEWDDAGHMIRAWLPAQTRSNNGYTVDPDDPSNIYILGSGNLPVSNGWLIRYKVNYKTGVWTPDAVWPHLMTRHIDGQDSFSSRNYVQMFSLQGRKYFTLMDGYQIYRIDGYRCMRSAGMVTEGKTRFFWHDANGDGAVQPEEYRNAPAMLPPGFDSYWQQNWLRDLSLSALSSSMRDGWRLPVSGFDTHGNPIFDGTKWTKLFTDPFLANRAEGKAGALTGGNELDDRYQSPWRRMTGTPAQGFWVAARGGKDFSANHGAQTKISYFAPDGQGGYTLRWRTGREALGGTVNPGEIKAPLWIYPPMHGLIAVFDNARAGVLLYTADEGLYVDTLFVESSRAKDTLYGMPGEWWSGFAYMDPKTGKVYIGAGKAQPLIFEVEGWTAKSGVMTLPLQQREVTITSAQIASPSDFVLQLRGGAGAAKLARWSPALGGAPALDGSLIGWESCAPMCFQADAKRTVELCGMYDRDTLYLRWHLRTDRPVQPVTDKAPERIFTHDRGADTMSLYLQGDAAATPAQGRAGRPGDVRMVFGLVNDGNETRPIALGMYPSWFGKNLPTPLTYGSPVGKAEFAHVGPLAGARLAHRIDDDQLGFVITAAIPRTAIPLAPSLIDGWRTMGNLDATFGGHTRVWWANSDLSASAETFDEPSEAHLYPSAWAPMEFAPVREVQAVRAWSVIGSWSHPSVNALASKRYLLDPEVAAVRAAFDSKVFAPELEVNLAASYAGEAVTGWPGGKTLSWATQMSEDDDAVALGGLAQVYHAVSWIWSPAATQLDCEFLLGGGQTVATVTVNGQAFSFDLAKQPDAERHRMVAFNQGWNRIAYRGYALSSTLRFGLRVHAPAAQLWTLKFSPTTPPQ